MIEFIFKTPLIFIHYASGTFGSTLYHMLHNTKECQKYFNISNKEIFNNENKTAHAHIIEPINGLHGYYEFNMWMNMNEESKKDYILQNLHEKINFNKLQPPIRLSHYQGVNEVKKLFTNSFSIFILFKEKYIELIADITKEKLLSMYDEKDEEFEKFFNSAINGKNNNKQKILKMIQKNKLKNIKRLILNKNIDIGIKNMFNSFQNLQINQEDFVFDFENFFSYDLFSSTTYNLLNKLSLNFEDDFDLKDFYAYFYENNKKFINLAIKL